MLLDNWSDNCKQQVIFDRWSNSFQKFYTGVAMLVSTEHKGISDTRTFDSNNYITNEVTKGQ